MAAIATKLFGGMIPAIDAGLLPDTAAAFAQDVWTYPGIITGFPEAVVIHTMADPAAATVYRIPADYSNGSYLYTSKWMEFQNADTDVIRGQVFNDVYDRYYWASSNIQPKYNTNARIQADALPWLLGIPTPLSVAVSWNPSVPTGGPSVGRAAGSGLAIGVSSFVSTGASTGSAVGSSTANAVTSQGNPQVRAYGITRVSAYGEEGGMLATSAVLGYDNGSWVITFPAVAASDDGGVGDDRNIIYTNIYRTVVGPNGVTSYFFVAQVAASATYYVDSASDEIVSRNAILESQYWTPPPTDLEGWVTMPNGIIAGWRGNEIWFSEPYRIHAWPVAYVLTVEYPVIGLGVIGQTLVVCTAGYPVGITGTHPAIMSQQAYTNFEPCVSRGSVLSGPEGVFYCSLNGLVLVSAGEARNITAKLVDRASWQRFTAQSKLRAARLGTAYYAFGSVTQGAFEPTAFEPTAFTQQDLSHAYEGIMVDVPNQFYARSAQDPLAQVPSERIAFSLLTSDEPVNDVISDPWSGELFIVRNGHVDWVNQVDLSLPIRPYIWKSKEFGTSYKSNYSALKVYFTAPPSVPLVADYGSIKVFADGVTILDRALVTSGELFRLPSGFKADMWQFQIEGRVEIEQVQMATSSKELRQT